VKKNSHIPFNKIQQKKLPNRFEPFTFMSLFLTETSYIMKKRYLFFLGIFICTATMAQRSSSMGNVGIGTNNPDQSAVLDINSSNKGILIPRLSAYQRNSINNPASGLLVYQTNEKTGFYFYDGTGWQPMNNSDAKSVATLDVNGWALDGNATSSSNKALASLTSFIGTPDGIPLNFRIGSFRAGLIQTTNPNTSFGFAALNSITSGTFNAAFGAFAGNNMQSGSFNFALGTSALETNTSGSGNLAIGTASLLINATGDNNVALGTNAGRTNLGSGNVFLGNSAGQNEAGSNKLFISNSDSPNPLIKGDFFSSNIQVNSKTTGYLAVGDFTTATSNSPGTGGLPLPSNIGQAGGYRLVVQDGILCEKVKVALRATGSTDWADYVFEPDYKLKMLSLEDVEKFTKEFKHLPNVPTTEEVQKNGLDLHETSKMFMEKIEELYLYIFELKKEINDLKIKK
jgi:hypothetical protein